MTELEVQELLLMVAAIDGLRRHLDQFIHNVTMEMETIQVKLSAILKEVRPPDARPVSIST